MSWYNRYDNGALFCCMKTLHASDFLKKDVPLEKEAQDSFLHSLEAKPAFIEPYRVLSVDGWDCDDSNYVPAFITSVFETGFKEHVVPMAILRPGGYCESIPDSYVPAEI